MNRVDVSNDRKEANNLDDEVPRKDPQVARCRAENVVKHALQRCCGARVLNPEKSYRDQQSNFKIWLVEQL